MDQLQRWKVVVLQYYIFKFRRYDVHLWKSSGIKFFSLWRVLFFSFTLLCVEWNKDIFRFPSNTFLAFLYSKRGTLLPIQLPKKWVKEVARIWPLPSSPPAFNFKFKSRVLSTTQRKMKTLSLHLGASTELNASFLFQDRFESGWRWTSMPSLYRNTKCTACDRKHIAFRILTRKQIFIPGSRSVKI